MALSAGTKLGPYEILAPIGAGGMGEVYRALDRSLKREVALKVLPDSYARDSERLARFRREAELLASLNHPNIAAIYGLHSEGDRHGLAMELVPGETLAEQARRGSLELEEALRICGQIAEGLEHAHEKTIIHRDLKPANVKVTPEGKVKILDFGLAKAFAGDGTSGGPPLPVLDSNSPTLSKLPPGYGEISVSPTLPGVILGTAAYMSPEQAKGKRVDRRTDIWALGCVLYELLTGHGAFHRLHPSRHQSPDHETPPTTRGRFGGAKSIADKGPLAHGRGSDSPEPDTVQEIIARVLQSEPDWSLLPANTPPGVRALLRRCLQKDANKRLRGAADIALAIEDILNAPTQAGMTSAAAAAATPMSSWRRKLALSAVGLAALAVTALAVWHIKPAPPPPPVLRTAITLPPGQQLATRPLPNLSISRDGKYLAYIAVENQTQRLYLRPLDSLESKPVPGTENAVIPIFSPDSQWIGFHAGGKINKVSVSGGRIIAITDAPITGGSSWSSLGMLSLHSIRQAGESFFQVSENGGTPEAVTVLSEGETVHRWPEYLPDGKALLFVGNPSATNFINAQIAIQPLGRGERKNLTAGSQPRYVSTGHLLYAQMGTLMAAPFDIRRLELTDVAVPVLEGITQSAATGAAQYSVSSTGTLVYLEGGWNNVQNQIVWVNRHGEEQVLPAAPHNYTTPRISPDGRSVAVNISEQDSQIWVYDTQRDNLTRLTFEGSVNNIPAWSADGKRIAYRSNRDGPQHLYWQAADGSGAAERLTEVDVVQSPSSFSADGELVAIHENNASTGRDLAVVRLADRETVPFLRTASGEAAPQFSPDGKWLAYSSNQSGRDEIYVQPYPGPGGTLKISTDGGLEPVWNPRGGELFYRSGNKLMAVAVDTTSGFSATKPRVLFDRPYMNSTSDLPFYDVSPDGQRFLMLKPVEGETPPNSQINVVLNWFEELKQKVPLRQ